MAMNYERSASTGAYRLRGTFQQAAVRDFLFEVQRQLAYGSSSNTVAPPAPVNLFLKGLVTTSFSVNNRSGSAGVLGYGYCWENAVWKWGTWVDATTTFTDDTADAQDPDAGDMILFNDTGEAATDGWIILSTRPWSWLSINVSQASTGNTSFAVAYSNAAGTGWTNLPTNQALVDQMTITAGVVPAGEQIFCWNPPTNWGQITTLPGLTAHAGMYAFRVTIDAATITQSALGTALEIGSMVFSAENVADNASGVQDNITYQDYNAIGVVALIPAAVAGSNVDFTCFPSG